MCIYIILIGHENNYDHAANTLPIYNKTLEIFNSLIIIAQRIFDIILFLFEMFI